MFKLMLALAVLTGAAWVSANESKNSMNEIHTYMSFSLPVDPAKIITMPDLDLSYALASTLVEWDSLQQISAGLAERWLTVDGNKVVLTLRKNVKWSNNEPIRSSEIKASLERGFTKYSVEHRSLEQLIERIECPKEDQISFKLKPGVNSRDFLKKLTEPNYGILRVKKSYGLELGVSSGAFVLMASSENELRLLRNQNWHHFNPRTAKAVDIRKPPVGGIDYSNILLTDSWVNLVKTATMMPADLVKKYEKTEFKTWKRPIDKVWLAALGPSIVNKDGFGLLRFLGKKLNRETLTSGFSGFSLSEQLFPKGYALYDPEFQCDSRPPELSAAFKGRGLRVLMVSSTKNNPIQEKLSRALTDATGSVPTFILSSLQDIGSNRKKSDYDIFIGMVGIADPDPEGALSYYLEGDSPLLPSIGGDLIKTLDTARKETESGKRLSLMRKLVREATCEGRILPIYHFSTLGIARKELDLSSIPPSEESLTLSRIHFVGAENK